MPICPPCANAADTDQQAGEIRIGHPAEICRDHGRTPDGCGCAHQPAGTATRKGTARA